MTKDYIKAVEWYRKAAEQGHYGAQLKLRNLLEKQSLLTNSSNEQTVSNE